MFVNEGARVAVTGSNSATLEAARNELCDGVLVFASDGGDVAAQGDLAKSIPRAFGQLDVLFVNAGVADLRPLEGWDERIRSVATHQLQSRFFLIQTLLPIFAKPVAIVLNTSINAHIGMPNTTIHGASKAALLSLAKTLSGELIGRGIRVNAVSLGPIATFWYLTKPRSRWAANS